MAKKTLNFEAGNISDFIAGAPLQEKQKKPAVSVKEKKNKVVSITLRQSDVDAIESFCAKTGTSRSNLIRIAVRTYIDNNSNN